MVVAGKELAETLTSVRFVILLAMLAVAAVVPIYASSQAIRDAAEDASGAAALFLALFTLQGETVPSFVGLVGFIAPLLGIAFGFDAINGERAQGTLPRLLSHPIYRDDLINGKFVAGLAAIALAITATAVIVAGVGMVRLGIVPAPAEIGRLAVWIVVTILYVGLWLALAMLCSVVVRRAATSALIAIGLWLGLSLFGVMLARILAGAIGGEAGGLEATFDVARLEQAISVVNPGTVYNQATIALLNPGATAVTIPTLAQAIQLEQQLSTQLSLDQSLLIVWPQVVGLLAAMVIAFVGSYILFLRQEVRA
jgi:ABC-2 type transport system permease protein